MNVMERLLSCLRERHLTIGSCESFTAGLFCASLAACSGASQVLKGGIVTYASELKIQLAGVDADVIAQHGVISEACVKEMAVKARTKLRCDICVSFSGNAGPQALEGKPAGLVYCAIAYRDQVRVYELYMKEERNLLRQQAVRFVGEKVIEWLEEDTLGRCVERT